MNPVEALYMARSSAKRVAQLDEERAQEQAERDRCIRQAHAIAGLSPTRLAQETGLTRAMIYRIIGTK